MEFLVTYATFVQCGPVASGDLRKWASGRLKTDTGKTEVVISYDLGRLSYGTIAAKNESSGYLKIHLTASCVDWKATTVPSLCNEVLASKKPQFSVCSEID